MAGDIKERYINPSRDITNAIETAKKEAKEEGREEGRAEGLAEGHEKGKAEGLAEGHEKGLAEGLEKGLAKGILTVARKMKELGLPIEQISNATNSATTAAFSRRGDRGVTTSSVKYISLLAPPQPSLRRDPTVQLDL